MGSPDFSALHAAMRAHVDGDLLPCVSTAVLRGRQVVDRFCYGWADREARVPLREDHIFRIFSNTKLVTSCAILLLMEDGKLRLDDPVELYLPELGERQVLRPGATRPDDTEPARGPITLRHLMTHTAGLTYALFDPDALLPRAYREAKVANPARTLAEMVTAMQPLPLAFQPGTRWEYSMATDVLGRVVEVVAGESFGRFLESRIFGPLEMQDTGFRVPQAQQHRLCTMYVGSDISRPDLPGLQRADDAPYRGAYVRPVARESGGGGLVSTLADMVRLVQSLLPGGPRLLKAQTVQQMGTDQLPPALCVQFPNSPPRPTRGFGLGCAVARGPAPGEPAAVTGEVYWGGLAGTTWWFNPPAAIAGVLMTQRYFGSGGPHELAFRQAAYAALAS
jgi:CubicO group peptidase (beta-lactamase class C family)